SLPLPTGRPFRPPGLLHELRSWNRGTTLKLLCAPFLLTRCSSDLRYEFVSEACAQMLGHRPEELVGKKIAEVIGEKAFQTILPHVNAVLAGQRVEYEAEVHYKDVGPRFVHVTYTPDKDQFDYVRGWVASITDITERRQAEVALRELPGEGQIGERAPAELRRSMRQTDGPLRRSRSQPLLVGGDEMGSLICSFDWSKTPIGPVEQWSPSLRMMVSFLLANRFPLLLWWGSRYISIYNDAYRPILGTKHPWALGRPVSEVWS